MNRNRKVLISLAVVAVGLGAILCFMVGQRSSGSQSATVASRSVQASQSARPRQSAASHPQSSSSQPATDQFSDEDYQLMAYLKLVDEDGSGAASKQLASLDKLRGGDDEITMWNDLGDGHSIGLVPIRQQCGSKVTRLRSPLTMKRLVGWATAMVTVAIPRLN